MNERTFLSFIAFGIKKSNIQKMQELFLKGLDEFLTSEGFGISAINNVFAGYGSIELAKTDGRSILGNMNDLAALYKHFILSEGGFENCDLSRIVSKINRTPQRNLGWLILLKLLVICCQGTPNMPNNKVNRTEAKSRHSGSLAR